MKRSGRGVHCFKSKYKKRIKHDQKREKKTVNDEEKRTKQTENAFSLGAKSHN